MRQLFLLLGLLLFVSCSSGGSVPVAQTGPGEALNGLPSVGDLPRHASADFDQYQNGSEFIGAKNVAAEENLGIYNPTRNEGEGEYAYGLYMFSLEDYEGDCYVQTGWETAPVTEDLYIGLPNRVNQEWDWFQPGPGIGVYIEDVATYVDEFNGLYTLVLLDGSGQFSLDYLRVHVDPPYVRAIAPTVCTPGEMVQFSANQFGCEPMVYNWDFGDMATPSTSTEATPTVEITTVEGVYTISFLASNELGGETLEYEVIVRDWREDLPVGKLAVTPLKSTAVVGEEVPILVYCGDFPAEAPMTYMTGVAVTCETGGDYVDKTFNLGFPGGYYNDYDGCWAAMQPVPSVPLLVADFTMHAQPVNGQPDLVYFGFNITPIGGSNITTGGALMNCHLTFDTPGTYNLGFLAENGVELTYYSDDTAARLYWLDITNEGIDNTIVVTAE